MRLSTISQALILGYFASSPVIAGTVNARNGLDQRTSTTGGSNSVINNANIARAFQSLDSLESNDKDNNDIIERRQGRFRGAGNNRPNAGIGSVPPPASQQQKRRNKVHIRQIPGRPKNGGVTNSENSQNAPPPPPHLKRNVQRHPRGFEWWE
ncbi:hypothetical protein B0J11DRAFT_578580 [Dendryphion nanum]|uniref:Uncharacterized protein n=1 Tax=Dendryphion nanum TaxID=256645 RepID=A0A9P9IRD0_9PLEO|nr:hypothetical protein B0J11DRAFT_578580 [Dendryphion nanum]